KKEGVCIFKMNSLFVSISSIDRQIRKSNFFEN
ncbi:MAG: hypothetical protein ACI9WV_002126, partial [Patiriisocius sp.]